MDSPEVFAGTDLPPSQGPRGLSRCAGRSGSPRSPDEAALGSESPGAPLSAMPQRYGLSVRPSIQTRRSPS